VRVTPPLRQTASCTLASCPTKMEICILSSCLPTKNITMSACVS
jgi:hypothetical protein